MTAPDATIVFLPSGVRTTAPLGAGVLDAARSAGVDIDSTCGGRALCGRCQITGGDGLSPIAATEAGYDGRRPLEEGGRLSCQTTVIGDATVGVPEQSQIHRPVIRKAVDLEGLTLDPLVTAHYVEIPKPELGDERADAEILAQQLKIEWGIEGATVEPGVLPELHTAIIAGDQCVTAIVHRDRRVMAVRAGFDETIYGLAVDVGSTTIATYLVDLADGEIIATAGTMNPQIRFGEDLMSRVAYVMMNPGGEVELTRVVREAIDSTIDDLGPEIRHRIHDIVLVANPVMHHLLLGIDPTPLGAAPFTLTVAAPVDMRATDLDLDLPWARAHMGPCIAGHVGADAAAAVLNEATHRTTDPQLMIDIGTNAEIVLGTSSMTYAASSPTGPAFEGAQISCGMRATVGAIEHIRIDRESYEPRFSVIGSDLWSDSPGYVEATSEFEVAGLCGSAIIEVIAELYLAGICDQHGVIRGTLADVTDRVVPDGRVFRYVIRAGPDELAITQNDVRQIQLAGAALRAGIDLLMEHAGIDEVHDVRLAGAFGAHIDPLYALVLGLIPDCPPESVKAVGNAAGAGAIRMLVSAAQRAEIAETVPKIEKIETAIEPRFQELFVAAMAFPHDSAPSPHLQKVIDLPKRDKLSASRRRRRR